MQYKPLYTPKHVYMYVLQESIYNLALPVIQLLEFSNSDYERGFGELIMIKIYQVPVEITPLLQQYLLCLQQPANPKFANWLSSPRLTTEETRSPSWTTQMIWAPSPTLQSQPKWRDYAVGSCLGMLTLRARLRGWGRERPTRAQTALEGSCSEMFPLWGGFYAIRGEGFGIPKLYVKFWWPLFLAMKFTFSFPNVRSGVLSV